MNNKPTTPERTKAHSKSLRSKEQSSESKSKNIDTLGDLEDSNDLKTLNTVIQKGTALAHKHAFEITKEIIYVKNNKLIRKVKGKKSEILRTLEPRKVPKDHILLPNLK